MSVTRLVVLAACMLAPLAGAGAQAAVSGDVYATNRRGETLRAAGMSIVAVRRGGQAQAVMDSLCSATLNHDGGSFAFAVLMGNSDNYARIGPKDSAEIRTRVLALRDSLENLVVDTTRTSVDGHYHLRALPPGDYWIAARGLFADSYYQWWRAATVAKSALVVDLGPAVFTPGPTCGAATRVNLRSP
jgi:hypothetical protein